MPSLVWARSQLRGAHWQKEKRGGTETNPSIQNHHLGYNSEHSPGAN